MKNERTILIVDESEFNQKTLCKFLSEDYDIIHSVNREEALNVIRKYSHNLSAIILEINMDGFELLKVLQNDNSMKDIPVIISTGKDGIDNEEKALLLGACDFIVRPYNADVIKIRLRNAIERSQLNLLWKIRYQSEHDALTGLYNTKKFLAMTKELVDKNPGINYVMLRLDINRFRQYNSMYGEEEGDKFIKYFASVIPEITREYSSFIYGRIQADIFAVCTEYTNKESLYNNIKRSQKLIRDYNPRFEIVSVVGMYFIENRDLMASEMLDRAKMAAKLVKGGYQNAISEYNTQIDKEQEVEQGITYDMYKALEDEQFIVYYQPKYNIVVGTPCGAEALVRWKHPKKGLISPGTFIPVFEKTGFVAKVDYYVWEVTCRNLKRWKEEGLNPGPVSVNVSRVNLNNPNLVDMLVHLVEKYELDPSLLQLEITETEYMENPDLMARMVQKSHEKGFTILMDDFGSGYSSLNTLKEISVDILKIDMKFLPAGGNNSKSEKILAAMIRMADWLGMPVIVEGVETKEQKRFLQSVGCQFVQGYYYGRPMPVDEYEDLIKKAGTSFHDDQTIVIDNEGIDNLISSDPKTEALLSSIAVPLGIYEYKGGRYDRIRANKSFYNVFGYSNMVGGGTAKLHPGEHGKYENSFARATSSKSEIDEEFLFKMSDGSLKWFRAQFRHILSGHNVNLICVVFLDITEERRATSEIAHILNIVKQGGSDSETVLLIDGNLEERKSISQVLTRDFRVISVGSSNDALKLLKEYKSGISVVVMDFDICRNSENKYLQLRNQIEGAARIPLIAISQNVEIESLKGMEEYGIFDVINRPVLPEIINNKIKNIIKYQKNFRELIIEYRKSYENVSVVAPDLSRAFVTINEVKTLVTVLSSAFDVVRLVNPVDTTVLNIGEDGIIYEENERCFKVWNKSERCKNCSSRCALRRESQITKYEQIGNENFFIISRPIRIMDNNNKLIYAVLEIVSKIVETNINNVEKTDLVSTNEDKDRIKLYQDQLTGVYNRRYLYEFMFIHHQNNSNVEKIAFIILKLRNLSEINSKFGYKEGDRILKEAACIISNNIRKNDSIIRYGGDEFIITLIDCSSENAANRIEMFKKLTSNLSTGDFSNIHASISFGFVVSESFRSNPDSLKTIIKEVEGKIISTN